MRTAQATRIGTRSPLLAALVGFCLIVLAGLSASPAHHAAARSADAVAAAAGDVAVSARLVADRLPAAQRVDVHRHVPPSVSLPAGLLVALLLALRVRHARSAATGPLAYPLVAAGRGPPVTS